MTKFKLTILMLLITAFGVVVSGCVKKPQPAVNVNQPVNTNTSTTTAEVDTSDWKTYRNEEYGFEFKYPGDWKVVEEKVANPWFKIILQDNLTISNLPIGFENAQPLDKITIEGQMYNRSFSDRINYKQHIIMLNNGYYIYYTFKNEEQLKVLESVVLNFKKIN